MTEERVCCLCGETFVGFGNNPAPLKENNDESRCCDLCNDFKVLPARLYNSSNGKGMREVMTEEEIKEMYEKVSK